MRLSALNSAFRRLTLTAFLLALFGTFAPSTVSASIAILQQPFPYDKVPMPNDDDDIEPVPEPELPPIGDPRPGPGDDTPPVPPTDDETPRWPWDDFVDFVIPGVIEIVTTDEDEDDGGRPDITWEVHESGVPDWIFDPRPNRPRNDEDRPDDVDVDDPDRECDCEDPRPRCREECEEQRKNEEENGDGTDGSEEKDDDGKDDDGETDGGDSSGESGFGSDHKVRWQRLRVEETNEGRLLTFGVEMRFSLPDLRFAARFRMHAIIIPDSVQFRIDGDSIQVRRPFERGDVDNDGTVGMADGIQILKQLFDRSGSDNASPCSSAEDTNNDGVVDMTDALKIFNHLYLGGPSPAAPYGNVGYENDLDDNLSCPLTSVSPEALSEILCRQVGICGENVNES